MILPLRWWKKETHKCIENNKWERIIESLAMVIQTVVQTVQHALNEDLLYALLKQLSSFYYLLFLCPAHVSIIFYSPMKWWRNGVSEVTNHRNVVWSKAGYLPAPCQWLQPCFIYPLPASTSDHSLMAQATLLTETFLIQVTMLSLTF